MTVQITALNAPMSLYLQFALVDWFGIPVPKQVAILCHTEDWANRQIVDEFRAVFPNTRIQVLPSIEDIDFDLLVIPYMHNFYYERAGGIELYRRLAEQPLNVWVLLYGLDNRKLDALPAAKLLSSVIQQRKVSRMIGILRRLRLLNIVYHCIRWSEGV